MENRSVSDIISPLKSASDSIWRDAQLALIRREQRLEIEKMEMEGKYDSVLTEKRILKKQYDELAREDGELEKKFRVCREELEGLREKVARLEEQRVRERRENVGGLLDRIRSIEEQNRSLCGRAETAERGEREGREENGRLLEKWVKKGKSERREREVGGETAKHLQDNLSLEKGKGRGFDEAENYKKVCIRLKEQFQKSNDNLNSSNPQAGSPQAFDDKESMSYGFIQQRGCDVEELPFCIPQNKYFRARANTYMNMSLVKLVKESLSPNNLKILEDSPFGFLVKMGDKVKFHMQVVHSLLLRRLKSEAKNELWFKVGDKVVRFGKEEFSLLTGMECQQEEEAEDEAEEGEEQEEYEEDEGEDEEKKNTKKIVTVDLQTVMDGGKKTISELEKAFMRECKKSKKKLCMAFILLLDGILLARDRKNKVRRAYASALCHQRRRERMPWGHLVFLEVLNALKKAIPDDFELKSLDGGKDRIAYNLYGFPLVFQIWVYEAFPDLAEMLGAKKLKTEEGTPLCLRWKTPSVRGPCHDKVELLLSRDVGFVRRYLNSGGESGEEDNRRARTKELSGCAPTSMHEEVGTKKRKPHYGKQQTGDSSFLAEDDGAWKRRRAADEIKDGKFDSCLRVLERIEAHMTRQFEEFQRVQNEQTEDIRRMRDTQLEIDIKWKVCMLRLERLLNKERGKGVEDSRAHV